MPLIKGLEDKSQEGYSSEQRAGAGRSHSCS